MLLGSHALASAVDNETTPLLYWIVNAKVDAAFAVFDLAPVGAMVECRRSGIDIPPQLAVMGFGDFDIAAQVMPSLATIPGVFENVGRQTGSMLLKLQQGEGRAW